MNSKYVLAENKPQLPGLYEITFAEKKCVVLMLNPTTGVIVWADPQLTNYWEGYFSDEWNMKDMTPVKPDSQIILTA